MAKLQQQFDLDTGFRTHNRFTCTNRAAQAGVFELDIRIHNQPYIDVCE
jgi:hypothetical protein